MGHIFWNDKQKLPAAVGTANARAPKWCKLGLLGDQAQASACAGAVKSQMLFSVAYMR